MADRLSYHLFSSTPSPPPTTHTSWNVCLLLVVLETEKQQNQPLDTGVLGGDQWSVRIGMDIGNDRAEGTNLP